MAQSQRLVSNIKYYSLGVLSSKALTFLFIPIYSVFINPEALGRFQYLYSIIALIVPVIYQSIWEGMFRYSIISKGKEYDVINTTTKYCGVLSLLYIIVFALGAFVWKIEYPGYILLCGISQVAGSYWQYAARALKENKAYAIASIISTLVTVVLNVVLIIILKWQIEALFLALTIGSFSGTIYLEYKIKLIKHSRSGKWEKELLKTNIKYSLPLAINSISWWLVSSCNNIVVTQALGDSANGVMAMAQRFGSIFAIITSIINMAWQEESFRTLYDEDKDAYFNKVLDIYTRIIFSAVFVLIPVTFILYKMMVFGDYATGVSLTSVLYIIAAYNAITTHLGSGFLARGESNVMFWTTLLAGFITVVLSIILIRYFGIIGVLYASLIAGVVNFVVRVKLLRGKMLLKVNYLRLILLTAFSGIISFVCAKIGMNYLWNSVFSACTISFFVIYNKDLLSMLLRKFFKR